MTWVKLTGETPEIAVHPDGDISWNDSAQAMMCNPPKVDLFHDATAGRLGFKRVLYPVSSSLEVVFNGSDFTIASQHHLANAGISVGELTHTAAPEGPTVTDELGVFWIELPP